MIYFVVKEFKIFFSKLSKSVHWKLLQVYYKQQSYECYLGYHGNKDSIATSHTMV